MDILFSVTLTLCVLQVAWYVDMQIKGGACLERALFFSKKYKEELPGSKDILQAPKLQGTVRFQRQLRSAARTSWS